MPYEAPRQGTLFDTVPVPANEAELREKRVRARLNNWLKIVRAAEKMPWDRLDAEKYQTILTQSSNWLPEQERETLRADFALEMARLRAAGPYAHLSKPPPWD
jgi:hypothetical protein